MDKINIGCNGLIIKNNQIILGLRKGCYGEGSYGLPGGHLKIGEKIIDAVKRELKEEVGIKVLDLEFTSIIDQAKEVEHYIQVNFIVKNFQGKIRCLEPEYCQKWEWFNLDNLPTNIFTPHIPIIKAFKIRQLYSS